MKKKIINIITRLNVGGASVHVVNLTYSLQKYFDTYLVSGIIEPYEGDMSYYADKKNVPIYYIKNLRREISLINDFKTLIAIYKYCIRIKPDIVHTHLSKAGALGRLAALLAGVRNIYHTFHGNIFKGDFSSKKVKIFIFIERVLALFTTKIIAISEKQKNELVYYKIAKASKIVVIKLGFDFSSIIASKDHKNLFRSIYNIPKDSFLIALIGRLTYQKNPIMFLKIAENLKKKLNKTNLSMPYFVLVGDGDMRSEVQREIDNRELGSFVKIIGFVQDLKPVFADIDIIVLTSHFEGTPVAIIEAMANGIIPITTNVGGISDIIDKDISGFYLDDFEVENYSNLIVSILNKNYDTQTISDMAREKIINLFHINRLVNDMIELYEQV